MVILMSEEKPMNAMYGQKVKLDLDKLKNKSNSTKDENIIEEKVVEEVPAEPEQSEELKTLIEIRDLLKNK
mgnify:CR=1 FL=1